MSIRYRYMMIYGKYEYGGMKSPYEGMRVCGYVHTRLNMNMNDYDEEGLDVTIEKSEGDDSSGNIPRERERERERERGRAEEDEEEESTGVDSSDDIRLPGRYILRRSLEVTKSLQTGHIFFFDRAVFMHLVRGEGGC